MAEKGGFKHFMLKELRAAARLRDLHTESHLARHWSSIPRRDEEHNRG